MRKISHAGQTILMTLLLVLTSLSLQARTKGLPDFTGLVEQNTQAVVNINTARKLGRMMDDDIHKNVPEPFRRYFEDRKQEPRSMGSGFVISKDGYVLTNAHVVKDAEEITVTFSDRRELSAKLVGLDEETDIALLKVKGKNFRSVKLGKSEKIKVGEWVLAIGSPFGFDLSVTAGIVSAKGRSLSQNERYVPFIQTDVAINPGNSGGPLFNLKGEVVGINSIIFTRSGGFMGLSFAIPISVAMDVVDQLKTTGQVTRGQLGIFLQEVDQDLADTFGLTKPEGALVTQVIEGSPAQNAGLQSGDIVLEYDGIRVLKHSDLPPLVGRTKVGAKVDLLIMREGKKKKVKVVVEAREGKGSATSPKKPQNVLGAYVKNLSEEDKAKLEVEFGVMVTDVMEGLAADVAGVRKGDVITKINWKKVTSVAELKKILESLPRGKSLPMQVISSNGIPKFIPITLPKPEKD